MSDNITPLTRNYTLKLSPTNNRVLALTYRAYQKCGADPVQSYGDLLSAGILAALFIGLTEDQVIDHIRRFGPQARAALAANPNIFGGAKDNRGGK